MAVLFSMTLMFGTVYGASLIDNGSFTEGTLTLDFTSPATCDESWCAKKINSVYEFEAPAVSTSGFDADSNSVTIFTNSISSTQ